MSRLQTCNAFRHLIGVSSKLIIVSSLVEQPFLHGKKFCGDLIQIKAA